MEDKVQIKNPREIDTKLKKVVKLLSEYHESLADEAKDLVNYEGLISQTQQKVRQKRNGFQVSLEKVKQIQNSDEARKAEQQFQKKLQQCDEQLRQINACYDEYIGLQHDLTSMLSKSSEISTAGTLLLGKIERILALIQDAT